MNIYDYSGKNNAYVCNLVTQAVVRAAHGTHDRQNIAHAARAEKKEMLLLSNMLVLQSFFPFLVTAPVPHF